MTETPDASTGSVKLQVCPSCGSHEIIDGTCSDCGWKYVPDNAAGQMHEAPDGVEFDPSTRSHVYSAFSRKSGYYLLGAFLLLYTFNNQLMAGFTSGGTDLIGVAGAAALAAYCLLAAIVNRRTVRATPTSVSVNEGPVPLPFLTRIEVPAGSIQRLDYIRDTTSDDDTTIFKVVAVTEAKEYDIASFRPRWFQFSTKNAEKKASELYTFLRRTLQIRATEPATVTMTSRQMQTVAAHSKWTAVYGLSFAGLMLLNMSSFYVIKEWSFDAAFWTIFAVVTALVFSALWFHHRKFLSLWTSKPLMPGESNPGPLSYMVISLVTALMMIPAVMGIWSLLYSRV